MNHPAADSEAEPLTASAAARSEALNMRVRDARGRKTMTALHHALLALIEEQPFERITIDDIVGQAGVSRSTFYRHYADKEALMEDIAKREIVELVGLVLPITDLEHSLPNCRRVIAHVAARRRLWSVLLTGGATAVMHQKFVELATPVTNPAHHWEGYPIPVDLSAICGVAVTVELLAWWLRYPDRASEEQAAQYLYLLAIRPALSAVAPLPD